MKPMPLIHPTIADMVELQENSHPLRILFVANDPPGHAVFRYRCENIAEVLRLQGHTAEVVYVGQPRVIVDHDVVVLHRICANAEGKRLAAAARFCGAALVYSTDDLVFDESALRGDARTPQRWADFAPLHRQMLCMADAVIVSTDFLKAAAETVAPDKKAFVIRNFLSPELLRLSAEARDSILPVSSGRLTLGYLSGSATHNGDLAFIAEALCDAMNQWKEMDLLIVGPAMTPPALAKFEKTTRLRRHSFVDWRTLPALLATIDLNLAPLEPGRPLNQGKSEIKALEAAAVGIRTLASSTGGFAEAAPFFPSLYVTDEWHHPLNEWGDLKRRRQSRDTDVSEALSGFGTFTCWKEPVERIFKEIFSLPRALPAFPAPQIIDQRLSPKYLAKSALKWLVKK